MYWSIGTTVLASAIALLFTHLDRRGRLALPLWGLPPLIAGLPQLALAALQWSRIGTELDATYYQFREDRATALTLEVLQTTELAFWSSALVATLVLVLITFGRTGDGRVISWGNAVFGLLGVVALGIVSPVLSAWLAPLVVLGVCAHATPKARSLLHRRITLAAVGAGAMVAANAALFVYDRQSSIDWVVTGSIVWTFDMLPLLSVCGVVIGGAVVASMFVQRR